MHMDVGGYVIRKEYHNMPNAYTVHKAHHGICEIEWTKNKKQ